MISVGLTACNAKFTLIDVRASAHPPRIGLGLREAEVMVAATRMVGIVGRLGVYPMVRLSLRARRVLAYLALRGQPVARGVVSADLWPDVVDDVGRANLRRALWHLPPGWVNAVGDELLLDAESDLTRARRVAARALDGEPLTFDEITRLS